MDPTRHENLRESVDRLDDQIPDTSAGRNPSLEVDTSNNGNIDTPMTLRGTPRLGVDISNGGNVGTMALHENPLPEVDTSNNGNIDTMALGGNPLPDPSNNQNIDTIMTLRETPLPEVDTSTNQNIDTTLGGNPLASVDTSNDMVMDASFQQTTMSRVISMPSLISDIFMYFEALSEKALLNRINKLWHAATLKDFYRRVVVRDYAALISLLRGPRENLKLIRYAIDAASHSQETLIDGILSALWDSIPKQNQLSPARA
jgi:hypothetical protein